MLVPMFGPVGWRHNSVHPRAIPFRAQTDIVEKVDKELERGRERKKKEREGERTFEGRWRAAMLLEGQRRRFAIFSIETGVE